MQIATSSNASYLAAIATVFTRSADMGYVVAAVLVLVAGRIAEADGRDAIAIHPVSGVAAVDKPRSHTGAWQSCGRHCCR